MSYTQIKNNELQLTELSLLFQLVSCKTMIQDLGLMSDILKINI